MNLETAGQTIAALVTVPVSATGTVRLFSQSGAHLIADVMGYYTPSGATRSGRLSTIEPNRVLDTRDGTGTGGVTERPVAGQALTLAVAGTNLPVPARASAVVLNLTATDAVAAGFVTAWPDGARPATSSLNVTGAGQTIANQVIVPMGANGTVQLFTQSGTHLIADVAGWFTGPDDVSSTSGLFVATTPQRHLDTRGTSRPGAGQSVTVEVAGQHLIPAVGVGAIVGTLTVTNATAPGFFTAYPGTGGLPVASNVNVERAGQTIANHITTRLANGTFKVATQTGGDIIVDVTGWYTE